jgi:hypothetical protein
MPRRRVNARLERRRRLAAGGPRYRRSPTRSFTSPGQNPIPPPPSPLYGALCRGGRGPGRCSRRRRRRAAQVAARAQAVPARAAPPPLLADIYNYSDRVLCGALCGLRHRAAARQYVHLFKQSIRTRRHSTRIRTEHRLARSTPAGQRSALLRPPAAAVRSAAAAAAARPV